jgi:hypothetical protein
MQFGVEMERSVPVVPVAPVLPVACLRAEMASRLVGLAPELWGLVYGFAGLDEEELVCTLECALDLEGPYPDVYPLVEGRVSRVLAWPSLLHLMRGEVMWKARMMAALGHPAKRLVFRVVLLGDEGAARAGGSGRCGPRELSLTVADGAQFFLWMRELMLRSGLDVAMSHVYLESVYPSGYKRRDQAERARLTAFDMLMYAYESESDRRERESTMDVIDC